MARQGITYEQVAAVADAIMAEGQQPTIRSVRERLRNTGSPNTIHKHLTTWAEARPVAAMAAPELPRALVTAFAAEIDRAASQARAEVEARLVHAQAEAADLAAAGEVLEGERDELLEQVASLTSERDTLAGKAEQQAADLAEQSMRVEREQQAAEAARVDLATARLKIEAHAERHAEQGAELERLRQALEVERKARVSAEQQAAVLEARLEAATTESRRVSERADKAEALAAQSAAALENARVVASEAQENSARLAGQVEALQALQKTAEQVAAQSAAALEAARAAAADARENGARLAGQVESLQAMQKGQADEIERLRTELAKSPAAPGSK